MKRMRDSRLRQHGRLGSYASSPIPAGAFGQPPAEWFASVPTQPPSSQVVDAAASGSSPSPAAAPIERAIGSALLDSVLREVRLAQLKVTEAMQTAQEELEQRLRRETEALRVVIGFDDDQGLVFSVPILKATDPYHPIVIASDDERALDRMRQGLACSGIGLERSVTVLVDPESDVHGDPRNLIVFCRDDRNPMTRAFLDRSRLGVRFRKMGTRPDGKSAWAVEQDGKPLYRSESYEQEEELEIDLRNSGDDSRSGVFTCPAIIARARSPYSPQTAGTVLVAGVRAFGTWGAADFLCSEAAGILEKTHGQDFVAVLSVAVEGSYNRGEGTDGLPKFYTLIDKIRGHELLDLNVLPGS